MPSKSEREAFEAWAEDNGLSLSKLRNDFYEGYGDNSTKRAGEAWQAARAAAPAPPSREPDESGWLIEKGRLCLGTSCNKPGWVTFTDPRAIRFARKVDAENMLTSLRAFGENGAFDNCTINGHMWCAPPVADSGASAQTDGGKE